MLQLAQEETQKIWHGICVQHMYSNVCVSLNPLWHHKKVFKYGTRTCYQSGTKKDPSPRYFWSGPLDNWVTRCSLTALVRKNHWFQSGRNFENNKELKILNWALQENLQLDLKLFERIIQTQLFNQRLLSKCASQRSRCVAAIQNQIYRRFLT